MKIYAFTLMISAVLLFSLKLFWPGALMNLTHHLNLLFDGTADYNSARDLISFFVIGELLLNYLILHKHILFKIIYCVLIAINLLLTVFLIKPF